jgi:hypothetical protein
MCLDYFEWSHHHAKELIRVKTTWPEVWVLRIIMFGMSTLSVGRCGLSKEGGYFKLNYTCPYTILES